MSNSANVSVGKPAVAGAIFRAPLGTAIPTDAVTALDKAFKGLGHCSDDGLTNEQSTDTDTVPAWGGATVATLTKSVKDSFKFTLIEALNIDVLKTVYGDENVEGDLKTGIKVKSNATPQEPCVWVIDMILSGGVAKRIVIPNGAVSEVGEISYKDDEVIGYETTLNCMPDTDGNSHYEYLVTKTA